MVFPNLFCRVVGIKSFSITRLKQKVNVLAPRGSAKSTRWNQKFLDYEIETRCAGAAVKTPPAVGIKSFSITRLKRR